MSSFLLCISLNILCFLELKSSTDEVPQGSDFVTDHLFVAQSCHRRFRLGEGSREVCFVTGVCLLEDIAFYNQL